ncbi:MAG: AAA family ATPase [Sphaerochaetaceae bacterium]|nr:AAA family ATPase [Sphaerochaetaceae bacterium]
MKRSSLYSEYVPVPVITGARQVGKPTRVEHVFSSSHTSIVFDPLIDVGNARLEPELIFKNNPGPLILDEIQYAPQLVPVLERIVDKDRSPGRYILSGSHTWGILNTIF